MKTAPLTAFVARAYPSRLLPALFYSVPLSVPYWNGATYRAVLLAICTAGVIDGSACAKLRSLINQWLAVDEALLCGSGSLALEVALRACGVGQGDEVVIPAFCCTSVMPPIVAVGATPVLSDSGVDLNICPANVAQVLTKKTKAVVVPHLFGNPADILGIIELVSGRGIHIIDDAAQALGATIDGRPVGSFGDAGILSFGSEKVCFGIGGGVFVSSNKEIFHGGSTLDLAPPRFIPTARSFFSNLIWRRWRRWTHSVQSVFARMNSLGPHAPPSPYRREAMANLTATVAVCLMQTLAKNITARRTRVKAYWELLGNNSRVALIPHKIGSACLTQVVRIMGRKGDDDPASRAIESLSRAGYEVRGSYVPIHLIPAYEKWTQRRIPHVEAIWSDLIELPCEPDVSLDHVERIAAVVTKVLNS